MATMDDKHSLFIDTNILIYVNVIETPHYLLTFFDVSLHSYSNKFYTLIK